MIDLHRRSADKPAWTEPHAQPGLADGPFAVHPFGRTPENVIAARYERLAGENPELHHMDLVPDSYNGIVRGALRTRSEEDVVAMLADPANREAIGYTRPAEPAAAAPGAGALLNILDALRVQALDIIVDSRRDASGSTTRAEAAAEMCADLRDGILDKLGLPAEQ